MRNDINEMIYKSVDIDDKEKAKDKANKIVDKFEDHSDLVEKLSDSVGKIIKSPTEEHILENSKNAVEGLFTVASSLGLFETEPTNKD